MDATSRKMVRSHLWSGRGGRSQARLRECIPKISVVSDHPVCAASVASRHFLNGAATSRLQGGEYSPDTTYFVTLFTGSMTRACNQEWKWN